MSDGMTGMEERRRGYDFWREHEGRKCDATFFDAIGRLLAERDALRDGMAREAAERYRLNIRRGGVDANTLGA